MISTLLIYTSRSTSQHQQEQQRKYRSGHVDTQTPDTSLSHLGKEKKRNSHINLRLQTVNHARIVPQTPGRTLQ